MSGTIVLTSQQFATLHRSVEETQMGVESMRIEPSGANGTVAVTFKVAAYGELRFRIDKEGKRLPMIRGTVGGTVDRANG